MNWIVTTCCTFSTVNKMVTMADGFNFWSQERVTDQKDMQYNRNILFDQKTHSQSVCVSRKL